MRIATETAIFSDVLPRRRRIRFPLGKSCSIIHLSLAIHETVEFAITLQMVELQGGVDIRWFSDGFANAVTELVIRRLGDRDELAGLEKGLDPSEYEHLKQDINLAHWLMSPVGLNDAAGGMDNPIDREREITSARYAFSFVEARRLIDAHGEGIVKKIMRELTERGRVRPTDYYDAVKRVTGEDMTGRLRAYQRFDTIDEGIKLHAQQYADAREKEDHGAALLALARLIELRSKNSYATNQYPVAARLYLRMGRPDVGLRVMRSQWKHMLTNFPTLAEVGAEALIDYAFDCGDLSMADDAAQDLIRRHPPHGPALIVLMDKALRAGEQDQIEQLAERLRESESQFDRKHLAEAERIGVAHRLKLKK